MNMLTKDYSILKIPAKQLTTRCSLVNFPLSQRSIQDIYYLKTCFRKSYNNEKALGLAAPQVGILKRIFIIPHNLQALNKLIMTQAAIKRFDVFINPFILGNTQQQLEDQESCLSVPGQSIKVKRWYGIRVKYNKEDGSEIITQFQGLKARIFQHELDHLEGLTIQRFNTHQKQIV